MTLLQWMRDGHAAGWPDLDDVAYHATTLFPVVRPRGWLELRMIDALPEQWWPVAVAVATALLDDPVAAATRVGRGRTAHASGGTKPPVPRSTIPRSAAAAVECFDAVGPALERLGADDATRAATAEYFDRFVARGRCPADELLDDWARLQAAGV